MKLHAFWYSALDRGKCWVWRTGRDNPPHLPQSGAAVTRICWQGGSEGHSDWMETSEEKRVLNCDYSLVHLLPKLLYRLSYPKCHMLVYYFC